MNRTKYFKRDALVLSWLVAILLLTVLPMSSVGQQPVIKKKSPVQLEKSKLNLQKVQPVQKQQKVIKKPEKVNVPTRIDPQKERQLKDMPKVPPPPDSQVPIRKTTEYPPEQEPQAGLERQPRPGHRSAGCFIATAAYGSPLAKNIIVMENFRDGYLLTNLIGKRLVAFYYKNSPPMADFIARHETLRSATRAVLWPLVFCIKNTVQAALILLVAGVTIGMYFRRRRYV